MGNIQQSLRIASYNIDFVSNYHLVRFNSIIKNILDRECDLILFQEVPTGFASYITKLLTKEFPYNIQPGFDTISNPKYHVMIFSKIQIVNPNYIPYELTLMTRGLLYGTIKYQNKFITIATTHLESMHHSSNVRNKQTDFIHKILGENPNTILIGDLNDESCLSSLSENWIEITNIDIKPTWHLQRIKPEGGNIEKNYDRVFISKNWSFLNPNIAEQISSEYLEKEKVWTSDHDGLLVVI